VTRERHADGKQTARSKGDGGAHHLTAATFTLYSLSALIYTILLFSSRAFMQFRHSLRRRHLLTPRYAFISGSPLPSTLRYRTSMTSPGFSVPVFAVLRMPVDVFCSSCQPRCSCHACARRRTPPLAHYIYSYKHYRLF